MQLEPKEEDQGQLLVGAGEQSDGVSERLQLPELRCGLPTTFCLSLFILMK